MFNRFPLLSALCLAACASLAGVAAGAVTNMIMHSPPLQERVQGILDAVVTWPVAVAGLTVWAILVSAMAFSSKAPPRHLMRPPLRRRPSITVADPVPPP